MTRSFSLYPPAGALLLVAVGVVFVAGWPWALILVGSVVLAAWTAYFVAHTRARS